MRRYEYLLFETAERDGAICQLARDTSERGCTPHMWTLGNRSHAIDQPAIEALCVVR